MPIIDIQDTNFIHRTQGTLEPNLLHWTRDSLVLLWPTIMKDHQIVPFILFILQISLSTITGLLGAFYGYIFSGIAGIAALFTLLTYGCGRYRHREGPSVGAKKWVVVSMVSILISLFSIASSFIPFFPFLDITLLVVVLTPVWWVTAPRIYNSRQQVLKSRGL